MRKIVAMLAAVILLSTPLSVTAGSIVLGADGDDPFVYHIDPWTGREWFRGFIGGFGASGVVALATDPVSRDLFASLETSVQSYRLVRYNARTRSTTDVGDMGERIVGLAFDSSGTLYGISDDDVGGTPDTIFTINTATAALTYFMDTPTPDSFNDTIAYNPDDGKLYHSNGYPGSFNAINLATKTYTAVGLPGDWPASVGIESFAYDSERGLFVGYRQQEFGGGEEYFTLTAGGAQTALATGNSFRVEGIAFYDEPPLVPPAATDSARLLYGVDANVNLLNQVDPFTGEDIAGIGVDVDGEAVSGFNGLAIDPTTREIYAVTRLDNIAQRLIVKVDPTTGEGTAVGDTGEAIAGIAFDDSGTLYAISGDGAASPSTIFTVDKSTGALTSFLALNDNGSGEAIAFNSSDGKLYRFSGETEIQAIDLATKAVTTISVSGDVAPSGTPSAVTYDSAQDLFLAMRWTSGGRMYYSMTPGGVATNIDPETEPRKGYAFSPEPPPYAAIGTVAGVDHVAVMRWDESEGRFRYVRIDVGTGNTEADSFIGTSTTVPVDFVTVPDLTGDNIGDVVFLTVPSGGGSYEAFVRNGFNGGFVKKLLYGTSDGFAWSQVVAVAGAAGPGKYGIAALGVSSLDNRGRVQVKDPATSGLIANIDFSKQYTEFGVVTLPDRNFNLVDEVATFGVDPGQRSLIQAKDGLTRAPLGRSFVASSYTPVDFDVVPDIGGGGAPEFAILATPPGDYSRLLFKDTVTGAVVANRRFDIAYAPIATVYVPDAGTGPAIGVLGRHADGRIRVTLQDASTFAFLRHIAFNKAYDPKGVTVVPDADGSGADEIVIVGVTADNEVRIQAKDAGSGLLVLDRAVP